LGTSRISRWLFLRLLGAIYLIAFVSLWVQVDGLIGSHGILAAADFLRGVEGMLGPERFWWLPTLCWLDPSDRFLHVLCGGGAALSVLLILGIAPVPVLTLLWVAYLSLTSVGQDFLSFQWDILLVETGFLAIFLAPLQLWPGFSREPEPPRPMVFLLRWLLFRLIFSSGAVKLLSGDPTWRNLTALEYHYWTQPLPTWIGWYANLLPDWLQILSCVVMFAIELGAPCLIAAPQNLRLLAFFPLVCLQVLILATGNYCFFNLLTLALCLMLLDDAVWPASVRARLGAERSEPRGWAWPRWITYPVVALIVLLSLIQVFDVSRLAPGSSSALRQLRRTSAPLRLVNGYGLFAVMTTTRPEIVIEGSDDGATWAEYEFPWKPGDLSRAPAFVEPHQPRLDWQMWFAALGTYENNPWFVRFVLRLLEGSEEVLALLEKNPFPAHPPRFIRAVLYQYTFTDLDERSATGYWWRRERQGLYLPEVSLKSFRRRETPD
jgi:lipase maturation factor 1